MYEIDQTRIFISEVIGFVPVRMSTHRARKRIREAKRKARPELATSDMWTAKDYCHSFDLSYDKVNDTLERINQDQVSEEEFIKRYGGN